MIDAKALLNDLKKRVTLLENDLRERCAKNPEIDAPLKAEYESARAKGRTGLTYNAWRDEEITQVAVAWILAGVFVRFLEDNELIEVPFLAGPNPERQRRALDEHSLFFRQHPTASEREYFEHVFAEVGRLPGMKHFFDRKHNPLWRVGPSADAAKSLLEFWRRTDPDTGCIHHDFTDPDWNTRFLGDLYQDLSEFARKRYALLQTPVFVEQFILDRTLTPAIQTFGFKVVRMIDPTCGSGHFLLGGFARLFRLWQENEPGENPIVLAQRALDQVYGVDLNPNVVAIARFRLLIAALRACGVTKLRHAPDFQLNLAAGDSLLHGSRFRGIENEAVQQTFGGDELFRDELKHFYETEDREELHRLLGQQYHAVVGNPPYITVKDRALNQAYRNRFDSCHRKYSLATPFMERFFDLAVNGEQGPSGHIGMITANSFMKREFGKKLIEKLIPKWNVTHVIDTSGAYIPGHGTPTVILLATNRRPIGSTVRTVMGIKGEPATPEKPANGLVWTAILAQVDKPGSESEYVSVTDTDRQNFHRHPWSIGGGGAAELKEILDEAAKHRLEQHADALGVMAVAGEDDIFIADRDFWKRAGLEESVIKPLCVGDAIRNWMIGELPCALFPYDSQGLLSVTPASDRYFWAFRIPLSSGIYFNKTKTERGMDWRDWAVVVKDKFKNSCSITYGEVATHNHFAFDRGGKVFNRTAPLIKLPPNSTEDDHIALLALLNSSVACFWLKQACFPKGGDHQGGEGARVRTTLWDERFAFNSTQLSNFPTPSSLPVQKGRELDLRGKEATEQAPAAMLSSPENHSSDKLEAAHQAWKRIVSGMIAVQEELDWECYRLYDVIDEDLNAVGQAPLIRVGERAFEIVIARQMAAGELETNWFERHGSTPITEIPAHWPEAYRKLVERRIELIETDRNIGLIEKPEYKRRWNVEPWDDQLKRALREWLLNRLEGYFFEGERVCALADDFSPAVHGFVAAQQPALVSTNQLAAIVEADADFLRLAEIYSGGPGFSVPRLVRDLVESESVPFLPFQRYKESGLRKRQDWEQVWDLQRKEDAIDAAEGVDAPNITDAERELRKRKAIDRKKQEIGDIPVPPKYASADFRGSVYWKLRGKLDVPKERWIIYPGAERDGDPSPMIAWAGWNHLQQAQALAAYYIDASQNQGWPAEKLRPLLAGLADLLPWLKQWHNEFNPDYASGLGDYFAGFLDEEARKQGMTIEALNNQRFGTSDI